MEVLKMGKKDKKEKKDKKNKSLFEDVTLSDVNAFRNLSIGGKKDKYDRRDNNRNDRDGKFKGKDFENDFMIKSVEDINQKVIELKKNDVNSIEVFKEKLLDSRFVESLYKSVLKAIDKNDDDEYEYSKSLTPFASLLLEVVLNNKSKIEDDAMNKLLSIIGKITKGRTKELKDRFKENELKVNKELINEFSLVIPSDEIIKPRQNIFELVKEINRSIYDFANNPKEETKLEKVKHIHKLYKTLFGSENVESCAIGCLLEKRMVTKSFNTKEQTALWELMTEFALETLENIGDSYKIEKKLGLYTMHRKNDAEDETRRIDFVDFSKTAVKKEYKNLLKAIENMLDNKKVPFSKYLS
jgi:hypothetical protein